MYVFEVNFPGSVPRLRRVPIDGEDGAGSGPNYRKRVKSCRSAEPHRADGHARRLPQATLPVRTSTIRIISPVDGYFPPCRTSQRRRGAAPRKFGVGDTAKDVNLSIRAGEIVTAPEEHIIVRGYALS